MNVMKKRKNESMALAQYAPLVSFNTSIEALVAQTLRNAITQGAFYPGQELDEIAIAEDLQISRMPVRQAMSALEVEGLVTRIMRKGVYVTKLDQHDLEEIYATRIALEELAIRAAIPKYTEEDFNKIENNLIASQEKISSYATFLEVDKEFHFLLYLPSRWRRVTKYIQQLRNNTAMYRILCSQLSHDSLLQSLDEHKKIFEACKAKKIEEAVHLLKEHTLRTIPTIKDIDQIHK